MAESFLGRQRRFRIPLHLWIRIQQKLGRKNLAEERAVAEETITENISSTGCYFFLSGKPPVGSIAEMEITLPSGYPGIGYGRLHCRGKVVRVEDHTAEGKVGVACAIESYSLDPPKGRLSE